jgi:radical SAM superfamily enzyme YgiQ (UPF0313 family)
MAKILFSHSYLMRLDPKQWATSQPYPPLATITAAAVCRNAGHQVYLHDSFFDESAARIVPSLVKVQPDIFILYDDGFNYLTKMCLTNMRNAAFEMCEHANKQGCTVIVSSSDSTDHFEQYLSAGADFVLLGEAEQTLMELLAAIENNIDYSGIKGIVYQQADNTIRTSSRPVMTNLDALPLPAWDLINIEPYRNMWMQSSGYFSLNVATTRGCPFKCNWCAKPIYGNRYNVRSAEHVVAELKLMKKNFAFDHIWFCDDIFGLKPGWINEFGNLVKEAGLVFTFRIQARADLLLKGNTINDLAAAGCENVWIGAESGSQKILDAMDKGITIDQIRSATKLLKEAGIKPSFFLQFGYPGETREDIRATIRMVNTLLPHSIGISVSYPLPGTVFYEKVKSELKEKTNWTDSDEMHLMFTNTYRPAFYKQLHVYTHKTFRKHVAFESFKNCIRKPATVNFRSLKKAASMLYYLPASIIAKQKLEYLSR